MRILITGAGGFIGSHMLDQAVLRGHQVDAVDIKPIEEWNSNPAKRFEYSDKVTFYSLDVSEQLPHPGFDLCFHLAAHARIQPSFQMPVEYVKTNTLGTVNVLDKAKQCGGRVVYAGSSTADGKLSLNVYATSKYNGELASRVWHDCFGVKVDIARFYNVYGPREIQVGPMATVLGIFRRQFVTGNKLTVTGDGEQRRDFTHIEDICNGLWMIAASGAGNADLYCLGTGENYSVNELAEMFVSRDRIMYLPQRPGEMRETRAKVDDPRLREIGWNPQRNVKDWIREIKERESARVAG